jgi:protein-arginine kinase activator protein McsA
MEAPFHASLININICKICILKTTARENKHEVQKVKATKFMSAFVSNIKILRSELRREDIDKPGQICKKSYLTFRENANPRSKGNWTKGI